MMHTVSRLIAIFVLVASAVGLTGMAAANPFAKLSGSWRGSGQVSPFGGNGERVNCRVGYAVSGANVTQTITCAGTDYRVSATGRLVYSGGKVTGTWSETNYGVGGKVIGTAKATQMYLRITGDAFSGRMSITGVGGGSHSVRITQFDAGSGVYTTMANMKLRR